MKKKVLYGVFMALFAFAAIGTLQSCKDDVSDLRTQTDYDLNILRSKLQEMNHDLAYYAKVKWVMSMIDPSAVGDKDEYTQDEFAALTQEIIANGGLYPLIQGVCKDLGIDVKDIVKGGYDTSKITPDMAAGASVWGRLNALKAATDAITEGLGLTPSDKSDVYAKNLKDKLAELMTDIYGGKKDGKDINGVLKDLSNLEGEVVKLESYFETYLKSNITGILIQGTDNFVFGNFSLPIGVKSNMLFGWYGQNSNNEAVKFPSDAGEFDVAGDGENPIPALSQLGAVEGAIEIKAGALYGSGDVDGKIDLGNLYLTINPTNVDFSKSKITLENSLGNPIAAVGELEVKKSDDKLLAFGYTRADEKAGNGFYEAQVLVDAKPATIDEIGIKIDDNLKTSAKNAIKDVSKGNTLALVKAIYDQMNGKLPAYAARYDWTNKYTNYNTTTKEGKESSIATAVLSQYDLAVATAKPLGYNSLSGKESSKTLPTFGSIDNFLDELKQNALDHFNISVEPITITDKGEDYEISFANNSTIDIEERSGNKVNVIIKGLMVNGESVGTVRGIMDPYGNSSTLWDGVNEAIASKIYIAIRPEEKKTPLSDTELTANIKAKVTYMTLEQQKQIAEVIDNVKGAVNDMADELIGNFSSYTDRLQKLVDLYNKVAGKINNFLENPNDYLQVAAFYTTANNGINVLSSDQTQPTVFEGTGEISLYLSSYTAEILAPAYKKYVAITKVIEGTANIKDANKGDLNKVHNGDKIMVKFPVSKGTYEITYQALDFAGRTSTRKFYIQVK